MATNKLDKMNNEYRIKFLEKMGLINPDCKTCQEYFYPRLRDGALLFDIFAPKHRANANCKLGKHPHCTCDSCF